MSRDPTLSEMQEFLLTQPYAAEADASDVAQAIYWFLKRLAQPNGPTYTRRYVGSDIRLGPVRTAVTAPTWPPNSMPQQASMRHRSDGVAGAGVLSGGVCDRDRRAATGDKAHRVR